MPKLRKLKVDSNWLIGADLGQASMIEDLEKLSIGDFQSKWGIATK